jgi:hypothetical protein
MANEEFVQMDLTHVTGPSKIIAVDELLVCLEHMNLVMGLLQIISDGHITSGS